MRMRRWQLFQERFPDIAALRVLDLGGTTDYWRRAPVRARHVTVVNLLEPGEPSEGLEPQFGDACTYQPDREYDLVVSNSLLEHVGGHAMRVRLAETIRKAAARHWVQTPYRYFPLEPHWLFPAMQVLPVRLRVAVAVRWPLAHSRPASRQDALQEVLWTELVGRTEMVSLFPDSEVTFETMLGLPKSLLAIRA
jgi:hypothetical protein